MTGAIYCPVPPLVRSFGRSNPGFPDLGDFVRIALGDRLGPRSNPSNAIVSCDMLPGLHRFDARTPAHIASRPCRHRAVGIARPPGCARRPSARTDGRHRKPSASRAGGTSIRPVWQRDTKTFLLAAFLSVPFATAAAVKGIQVGQSAKSLSSSNKFHRLGTTKAAWWARGFGV